MIALTAPQELYLRAEAARFGITVPDLIRRIVDHYREEKRKEQGNTP
jgi:hypothetical protein